MLKNTGACPKCASTDIRTSRRRAWGAMMPIGLTIFSVVYMSWFICPSCGFVETWIERKKDLARIRETLPSRQS